MRLSARVPRLPRDNTCKRAPSIPLFILSSLWKRIFGDDDRILLASFGTELLENWPRFVARATKAHRNIARKLIKLCWTRGNSPEYMRTQTDMYACMYGQRINDYARGGYFVLNIERGSWNQSLEFRMGGMNVL